MRLILLTTLLLAACSTAPSTPTVRADDQVLILDRQMHPMTRNEVIMAINECEANRTRAVVINSRRKINGVTTEVPVEVTCAPRYYGIDFQFRHANGN